MMVMVKYSADFSCPVIAMVSWDGTEAILLLPSSGSWLGSVQAIFAHQLLKPD